MKGVKRSHRAKTQVYRAINEQIVASVQQAGGWFTIFETNLYLGGICEMAGDTEANPL